MKKNIIILIILIIFPLLFIFNYFNFDEKKISVNVFGVENEIPEIEISYENDLYLCNNEKPLMKLKNGDSISFVCKFVLIPTIQNTYVYYIDNLFSNEDSVMTLISQWGQRNIKNVAYVLKLNNKINGSTYYTITLEDDDVKGYVDYFIYYNKKENKYVSIKNGQVKENFNYSAKVNFNSLETKDTIDFYIKELGYEIVYENPEYIPDYIY